MSENSNIEWTDHTFNPWIGCTKVSPGCANCYAESLDSRWGYTEGGWGKGKPRKRTSDANWRKPLQWNRQAGIEGKRFRVFCASLADWLDDEVPIEWLVDLLQLIVETPNLEWLLLTKRPESWVDRIGEAAFFARTTGRSMDIFCNWGHGKPPQNVWVGTTVEDQERVRARIPALVEIPAKVHFLSCEPLLEEIDLSFYIGEPALSLIDWVIVGGESGRGARPFDADWARSIQRECLGGEVPFFMKQMGGVRKPFPVIPDDLMVREFPTGKELPL